MVVDQLVVDQRSSAEVDRAFRALADATRRDILTHSIHEAQSVSALAARYAMSFAAVQKHVSVLERARLVRKERRGREQIVHAEHEGLRRAAALLDAYEQLWIDRAERMADLLHEKEEHP